MGFQLNIMTFKIYSPGLGQAQRRRRSSKIGGGAVGERLGGGQGSLHSF